jgi:hypothetical protein
MDPVGIQRVYRVTKRCTVWLQSAKRNQCCLGEITWSSLPVKIWSYDQLNRYYGTRRGIDIREIFIQCIAWEGLVQHMRWFGVGRARPAHTSQ